MKGRLLWKLSRQNLSAHRRTVVPFIVSSGIIMALLYIVISLIGNDYVQNRHDILPSIMGMAAVLTGLFTLIFMVYASRFIFKQRLKEQGLFSVLGMEKKHLRRMMRIELCLQGLAIIAIAIPGGYLFGHLTFLALNKLLRNTGIVAMDYPFSWTALAGVLLVLLGVLVVIYIMNALQISVANPIELVQSSHSGEKEPKIKLFSLIIGLLLVGYGYYLALTSQGILVSFMRIFIAAILVIIGSYLLLGSLSIFILKRMKASDDYFYRRNHFLTVSGMIFRMKANATSLTSIAFLCSGLMIISGMTVTAARSMATQAEETHPSAFSIAYFPSYQELSSEEVLEGVVSDLSQHVDVQEVTPYHSIQISLRVDGNKLQALTPDTQNYTTDTASNLGMATVMTMEDYNRVFDKNLDLSEDEIGLVANVERWNNFDQVNFAEKDFQVQTLESTSQETGISVDYFLIVIPTTISLEEVWQAYPKYDPYTGEEMPFELLFEANIEAEGDLAAAQEHLGEIGDKYYASIGSRYETQQLIYEINGGALFLGIVVSLVLLVGIFLIIYFKQISEGYQDRGNFHIMKQVGLDESMIKSTIRSQISWIFILPLAVAILHMIMSSRIVFGTLGLIAVNDRSVFISSYIIVGVVFIIAYALMYLITSRTYYDIVNQSLTG